ncbi:MAG: hypothetical protein AMXMBFR44_3690 [Candidatus Campbellbacteria bacterium]
MKNTIIALALIIILVVGGYFLFKQAPEPTEPTDQTPTTTPVTGPVEQKTETVIGDSVQGRDIVAYHYGEGDTKLLFVGGIHGGYEWNTVLVARELMEYLDENESAIPEGVEVTVVPVLNPDGLAKVVSDIDDFAAADVAASQDVVVSGRFNANNVDLNRNFDCGWQATGVWQNKPVSGGSKAFSEPESRAMRDFVASYQPDAVVVWYSAAGGVYASTCDGKPVAAETTTLTNTFATASGYPAFQSFDFYETTGDMVNWLAKNNIPAISVLLTNHTDIEWTKNLAGAEAVLELYAK